MSNPVNFAEALESLACRQVWHYCRRDNQAGDAARLVYEALGHPDEFPPIAAAIVPGDRVALAVDPNVPDLVSVISGTLKYLCETGAGSIDIVLWDESTEQTTAAIQAVADSRADVHRHDSSHRSALRYLGADDAADPIYLDRRIVDADFVLPIVAGRSLDTEHDDDLTGVYPALADSRSRIRHHCLAHSRSAATGAPRAGETHETSWLLGVQVMVSVTANEDGHACDVIVGTPDAVRKRMAVEGPLAEDDPLAEDELPAAPLVVASLDGDSQQQSWSNAARAIDAASRFVKPGGTIVLWSAIDQAPDRSLTQIGKSQEASDPIEQEPPVDTQDAALDAAEFPPWDETLPASRTLARIAAEHRLFIHSQLSEETIESMGLASIQTTAELKRLSESFDCCGILRAAQFGGRSVNR